MARAQLKSIADVLAQGRAGAWNNIGHNTELFVSNDRKSFNLKFHGSTIVSYDGDVLFVSTHGFDSVTTAHRIAYGLAHFGLSLHTGEKAINNRWRIAVDNSRNGDCFTIRGTYIFLYPSKGYCGTHIFLHQSKAYPSKWRRA